MWITRVLLVLLMAGGLAACGNDTVTVRYRVTVEVDTPQGLRTGSGIWDVSASQGGSLTGGGTGGHRLRAKAEAVRVELPAGQMYLLVTGPSVNYAQTLIQRHISAHPQPNIRLHGENWRSDWEEIRQSRATFDLYRENYPPLVTFSNPADPATARMVDPSNLAAAFGAGVRLRRISLAIVEEEPTQGLLVSLPWLERFRRGGTLGGIRERDLQNPARSLTYSEFIWWGL